MEATVKKTLWFDLERTQYYLIPEDAVFPEGNLAIYTLSGQTQHVDPTAVTLWTATETQASNHLQFTTLQLFEGASETLASFFTQRTPPTLEGDTVSPDLIAMLLGVTPDALANDKFGQVGLHNIFRNLADILANVISDDDSQLQTARQQLQSFRANLQGENINVHPQIELLPDMIHAWYQKTDQKPIFHQFQELLQTTAERLEQANQQEGLTSQQVLTELIHNVRLLFTEDLETPEQRQQRYREAARQSLKSAWGGAPPTFDFKKLWHERIQFTKREHNKEG